MIMIVEMNLSNVLNLLFEEMKRIASQIWAWKAEPWPSFVWHLAQERDTTF